jgi:hypothetical protein
MSTTNRNANMVHLVDAIGEAALCGRALPPEKVLTVATYLEATTTRVICVRCIVELGRRLRAPPKK